MKSHKEVQADNNVDISEGAGQFNDKHNENILNLQNGSHKGIFTAHGHGCKAGRHTSIRKPACKHLILKISLFLTVNKQR